MTAEEIIECNKLCFDFMGCIHSNNEEIDLWEMKQLKYHSSFDWIMSVYVKFKNLDIKQHNTRHYHKQVLSAFGSGILSGDINNAFNDAVMAIKWYNTQHPKQ